LRAQGQVLKKQGQQLALFNAGRDWIEQTLDRFAEFCKSRKADGQPEFRFEEFRDMVIQRGWPEPASHKAWGALPRAAVKRRLIRATNRYEPAQSRATHAHPVRVWSVL